MPDQPELGAPPLGEVTFAMLREALARGWKDFLARPGYGVVFSLFYVLPTFFNSDLDRGFSVIDYDLNQELVSPADLDRANELNLGFKFDLVLNHLSVNSPQFQDMLTHGDTSDFRDFFIDWNEFWQGEGEMGPEGHLLPKPEHLEKLFMRKPGLPILKVRFPDGSERPYWNTFYQETGYPEITLEDLEPLQLGREDGERVADSVNAVIVERVGLRSCERRGAAIDVIVDRSRENRS